MTQYIDKDKLLLELTRRLESYKEEISKFTSKYLISDIIAKEEECKELISFIDTLEVKEVDLEKEVVNWWNDHYKNLKDDYKFGKYNGHYMDNSTIISLAKHFFELGIKARKRE